MSLHMDENAVRDRHAEIAGKSAKRKSRKVWALAAVGTLFAGTAAKKLRSASSPPAEAPSPTT